MGRKLAALMNGHRMVNLIGTLDRDIPSIAYDSRQVQPGGLFVAIPGTREDGVRYIADAARRGAHAVITQATPEQLMEMETGISSLTQIHVENSRHALAWVSDRFFDHPSRCLNLVGVTGTNGKTTLTYLLESIYTLAGRTCGILGSIHYRYPGNQVSAPMTTPESLDLNRMLRDMVTAGVSDCFLEISSHALAQQRVSELTVAVAAFTNLSRDHLDFHGTEEDYKAAKKVLFRDCRVKQQVINLDDPMGKEILAETQRPTLTTGIESPADVRADDLRLSATGVRFTMHTPQGRREIRSALLGQHNVRNLLSAAAVGLIQDLPLDTVAAGLEALQQVPGRFEEVRAGQDLTVVVDYAHTDDALKNALAAAKSFATGRVLTVFGCGGDRDRSKRGPMGRIALAGSDFTVITSDNPRTEDPQEILDDILAGLPADAREGTDFLVIPDRRQAIECAIQRARPHDLVLIAGKGHEDYQILGKKKIHFDDREVAREALLKRRAADA
ncbi:MAG: UDP-N-acetylmuramoyl-L-alanyl-D-glutamate--2,6-diaminopimelate ligase [Nitrospinaceae bacterium]